MEKKRYPNLGLFQNLEQVKQFFKEIGYQGSDITFQEVVDCRHLTPNNTFPKMGAVDWAVDILTNQLAINTTKQIMTGETQYMYKVIWQIKSDSTSMELIWFV